MVVRPGGKLGIVSLRRRFPLCRRQLHQHHPLCRPPRWLCLEGGCISGLPDLFVFPADVLAVRSLFLRRQDLHVVLVLFSRLVRRTKAGAVVVCCKVLRLD